MTFGVGMGCHLFMLFILCFIPQIFEDASENIHSMLQGSQGNQRELKNKTRVKMKQKVNIILEKKLVKNKFS